jgi:glutamine amidotransferase
MTKVALIDYKMGNLFSIAHACQKVGLEVEITNDPIKIKNADALILPGVGAYPLAVEQLNSQELEQPIIEFAKSGKYIFGICLGMQLLMEQSNEFGIHKGLGLIAGEVLRFPESTTSDKTRYIPQIAWNNVSIEIPAHPLFKNISNNEYYYFVHSNYVQTKNPKNILCSTDYGNFKYSSAIVQDNLIGIQFHPEKSSTQGLQIIENYKHLIYK